MRDVDSGGAGERLPMGEASGIYSALSYFAMNLQL